MSASSVGEYRLEHLVVLLDRAAVPFCAGENPFWHLLRPQWIPLGQLKAVVGYAEQNGLALSFVLGNTAPPAALVRLMNRVPHTRIVPAALDATLPGDVVVVSSQDHEALASLTPGRRNLFLRLARSDLAQAAAIFARLAGTYGRLTVVLTGLGYFDDADLAVYKDQLRRMAEALKDIFEAGNRVEVNLVSDRMLLTAMNNCDAGVRHVTVAPDGSCHICPAFYYDGAEPIGRFDADKGLTLDVPRGLALTDGPLCSRCDAFHCKRCVWLNRTLTLEYNVPSWQQCQTAHAEREAARLLLRELSGEPFISLPRIAEINYADPLELIERKVPKFGAQSRQTDPML